MREQVAGQDASRVGTPDVRVDIHVDWWAGVAMRYVRSGSGHWLTTAAFVAALYGMGDLSAQATESGSVLRGTVFDSPTMSP